MNDNECAFSEMPAILDGEFFKIVSRCESKVVTQCRNCPSQIQGDVKSSGNFIKHLKRKHPSTFTKFDAERKTKKKKLAETCEGGSNSEFSKKTIQGTLFQKTQVVSKRSIDDLVMNYIVEEMRPISTVEKSAFVQLVEGLSGRKPNDRKTLKKRLDEKKSALAINLKDVLNKTKYVCTTADVWSTNNKSYLGMTVHFIHGETFERKSFVLGCRRFKFNHTFDKIAELINQIHTDYNLDLDKISATVTDNASNFNKAFNIFSLSAALSRNDLEEFHELENPNDAGVEILPNFDLDSTYVLLPQHFKCCSHTLNLIATTDAAKAKDHHQYNRIQESVFKKACGLWNLVSRSTKASDHVEQICGIKLTVPCPTRWNSLHDACVKLISVQFNKLHDICNTLRIDEFQQADFQFITEYIKVTKPLARAIDILQGEKNCNLGTVLPTLFQIKKSLNDLTNLKFCSKLKECILLGFEKRFSQIMDIKSDMSQPYLLATICNPKFQLRWLGITPFKDVEFFNNKLRDYAETISSNVNDIHEIHEPDTPKRKRSSEDFFDFLTIKPKINSVTSECSKYLEDQDTDYSSLNRYPLIKDIFLKFNCITPSSAPVERLFSMGGQILTPRRNKLSDQLFETMLILKGNKLQ